MSGFTKLFGTIITSSIWSEDDKTRIMWITMLASANATGNVSGSIPGMAAIARMSLQDAERSIKSLCSPDPYSRSKEYEGRRLLECDGGWLITNYQKYRQKRDPEIRREQNREAKRRQRSQQKVSQSQPKSAQAEAEAELKEKSRSSCVSEKDIKSSNNSELFERFWTEYPRKVGKKKCRQIWKRLKPSVELTEQIITKVKAYKRTEQWQKDNGEFIPHPATWLNQGRWEDEIAAKPEPQKGDPDWLPTENEVDELFRQTGIKT